jgi:hypothetical protein
VTGEVAGVSVADLAAAGLLPHPSAVAEVVERFGVPGSPDPLRLFASRVLGGLDHEVIASRGLDIGHASWRGVPLSWRSPVRDSRALDRPAGPAWLERFTGGLLTTCGPFTIGEGDEEHGLHGDFSHRPAARVIATTRGGGTVVGGAIEVHDLFGASVTIERTIVSEASGDHARITVTDDVINTGPVPAPVAMLYHVNIGPPVAVPGATVRVGAADWTARASVPQAPAPSPLPNPTTDVVEAVFMHTGLRSDAEGWSRGSVTGSGIEVEVAWRPEGLPHFHQWIYPTAGRWALALEPSSAPLFGVGRDLPHRGAPVLPPGASRRHEIMVSVREAA